LEAKNTCSESLKRRYENVCEKNYTDCNNSTCFNDIELFSPLLCFLSGQCDHVTEFGVRTVCSTWALMAGLPKVLRNLQ
jgi:hypothetical protein